MGTHWFPFPFTPLINLQEHSPSPRQSGLTLWSFLSENVWGSRHRRLVTLFLGAAYKFSYLLTCTYMISDYNVSNKIQLHTWTLHEICPSKTFKKWKLTTSFDALSLRQPNLRVSLSLWLRDGATGMAAMAMAIPLLGALWPLMALVIALFRTMLFSV